LVTIAGLLAAGARVRASDPVALETAAAALRSVPGGVERVQLMSDEYACAEGADALVICTEWNDYRNPDFARLKAALLRPVLVDGRNLFEPARMARKGFIYYSVGRPSPQRG
jgi:UDPglucose 6-dehydrogenase